jgi:hypothetical protein
LGSDDNCLVDFLPFSELNDQSLESFDPLNITTGENSNVTTFEPTIALTIQNPPEAIQEKEKPTKTESPKNKVVQHDTRPKRASKRRRMELGNLF